MPRLQSERDQPTAGPLVSDAPVVQRALALIQNAYASRLTHGRRDVEHPLLVGVLLAADGQPPAIVAAGLLHDVLEDTSVTVDQLSAAFSADIVDTVQALTEDRSIAKYARRKAALRRQVFEAGRAPATVSTADKLAKLRFAREAPAKRKLAHYRATLEGVERRYGTSRLSGLLRDELTRWPER